MFELTSTRNFVANIRHCKHTPLFQTPAVGPLSMQSDAYFDMLHA